MNAFGDAADPAVLASWRAKNDRPRDAWMWYETLRPFAGRDLEMTRDIVFGKENEFLRTAALEALGTYGEKNGVPSGVSGICMDVLGNLPRDDVARALLTESVARVLLSARGGVRGPRWKPVADGLIAEMGAKGTADRTLVVLSRYLAKTLNVSNLGLDPRWWKSELDHEPMPKSNEGQTRTVPFFSVRTFGTRFVYVIDASDSMLKKVSDREKQDLGPVTGVGKKREKGSGALPGEKELDWSRISTRFDVAREYLRQSLESLDKDDLFAVVLFGDEAEPLNATPRLVAASPHNVHAAMAELDKLKAGPPTDRRPDGELRGKTNLHAGLRCAFELTTKGRIKGTEYVDPKGLIDGCDTIFLLSDGKPSWQDWTAVDRRDPEDQVGDPETGARGPDVPTLVFQGPYGLFPWDDLLHEARRLNLFRKAEIHCVGIGEADARLLQEIADIGMGQFQLVQGQ